MPLYYLVGLFDHCVAASFFFFFLFSPFSFVIDDDLHKYFEYGQMC